MAKKKEKQFSNLEDLVDATDIMSKDKWGKGEWSDEPDKFEMTYKGFKCNGRRNVVGAWCGYVAVPVDGIYYKNVVENHDYDSVPIDVHGGVTYGSTNDEEGLHYIGFDCAHYNDYMPTSCGSAKLMQKMANDLGDKYKSGEKAYDHIVTEDMVKSWPDIFDKWPYFGTYRNIKFVKKELRSMVNQIIKEENDWKNKTTSGQDTNKENQKG
jgi:hypothetical protein